MIIGSPFRPASPARRSRRLARRLSSGLLAGTVALTGCAGTVRERIYRADEQPVAVADWTRRAPEPLRVTTQDGLDLDGYYWPGAPGDRDVILFFHGRGSNQGRGARYAEHLTGRGDHVIVVSYRGFGGNPGAPSQAGLVDDGRAFVAKARELAGPNARVYLVGHSLGGAVALHVAAREPVAGVVTLSTFDRLAEEAPAGLAALLPDRWNNLEAVAKIHAPFVMVQGTADDRIAMAQANRLFARAPAPATFITAPGETHQPDMALIGPIISQAVSAIDSGALARFPADLPPGWSASHK